MESSEIIRTNKGKPCLVLNGYQHRIQRKKTDTISWICLKSERSKCRGVLKTNHQYDVLSNKIYHFCELNLVEIEVKKAMEKCRKRVREETSVPVNKIFKEEMAKMYDKGYDLITEIPTYSSAKTVLCLERRKSLGKVQIPRFLPCPETSQPETSRPETPRILNTIKKTHLRCTNAKSSAWAATKVIIDSQLDSIKEAKTYKNERVITSKQASHITVEGSSTPVINFCANNYLGLSSHPAIIEAGKQALDTYGAGLSSVRFICGTQSLHKQLEKKIAKFHGREDSILYPSCFDANAGLFEALLTADDAVLSDELNHASIIDGIRLCKAQKYRYKHRDMADLENKLQESSAARMKLIATDGVFSMDGNIAPLLDICNLAKKYNAMVFLDECHATGVFGKTGRGTEEHFNLNGKVDIINSTLGKALGGAAGGYTTGRAELIKLLRQKSRPYLFSNALPPPVTACASKALDLLFENSALVEKLHKNTQMFRSAIKAAGLNVIGDDHPICPVMLSEEKLAIQMANKMLDHGIYVIGFTYPVVPKNRARVRVQISAGHSENDIMQAVKAFNSVASEIGILKKSASN